jgi:RNA polymerase sigma factor (sigma-70 family)
MSRSSSVVIDAAFVAPTTTFSLGRTTRGGFFPLALDATAPKTNQATTTTSSSTNANMSRINHEKVTIRPLKRRSRTHKAATKRKATAAKVGPQLDIDVVDMSGTSALLSEEWSRAAQVVRKDTARSSQSRTIHDAFEESGQRGSYAAEAEAIRKAIVEQHKQKEAVYAALPSKAVLRTKIAELLCDDDGEEDVTTPDDSEAAANQIADKASFSKMSDEAKIKATEAVSHSKTTTASSSSSSTMMIPTAATSTVTGQKRKVRASVQETGSDTMSEYAKTMGNHEFLCREDEIVLGRQIQILVKWEAERMQLEETLLQPPTFAQWSEAVGTTVPELKKQIRRSNRAKAALIEANLRLVVSVARQTVKKNRSEINFQDACQEGIFGLTRAAEKFDPEMGFRFSTYAIWWIKKEVHRNVKDQGRTVRLPASAINKINEIRIGERVLMEELGRRPSDEELAVKVDISVKQLTFYRKSAQEVVSLDKSIVAKKGTKGSGASGTQAGKETSLEQLVTDPSQDPTKDVSAQMLKDDVRRLIKTLSPREQAVIRLRFGLDDGKPRTLDDIGKKFSVAKESIRKIEASALLKLRQPYRNKSVKCYISDL